MWVESELGRGSTFYFTVRLLRAKERPSEEKIPGVASAPRSALRVLLAEDSRANQKLARYLLEQRGHTVEIAADGRQALRMSMHNRYDAILMDVQMPEMDGLQATKAIRAQETDGRRVPIIAMTAHAMLSDRERCVEAGMDAYLSKPIDRNEMISLVENLAVGAAPVEQAATPIFDPELAAKRCFNNPDMVREILECFLKEVDLLLPQMHAAFQKGDFAEVGRLGHHMKGTVVYLGAEKARQAALAVEQFCTSGNGTPIEAEKAIHALEKECLALKAILIEHPLIRKPA